MTNTSQWTHESLWGCAYIESLDGLNGALFRLVDFFWGWGSGIQLNDQTKWTRCLHGTGLELVRSCALQHKWQQLFYSHVTHGDRCNHVIDKLGVHSSTNPILKKLIVILQIFTHFNFTHLMANCVHIIFLMEKFRNCGFKSGELCSPEIMLFNLICIWNCQNKLLRCTMRI